MKTLNLSKEHPQSEMSPPVSWAGTVYFTQGGNYETYIVQADTEQGAYETLMGPLALDTYLTDYLVRLS